MEENTIHISGLEINELVKFYSEKRESLFKEIIKKRYELSKTNHILKNLGFSEKEDNFKILKPILDIHFHNKSKREKTILIMKACDCRLTVNEIVNLAEPYFPVLDKKYQRRLITHYNSSLSINIKNGKLFKREKIGDLFYYSLKD